MILRAKAGALFLLAFAGPLAAQELVDVDELPRTEIPLANGGRVFNVRYLNRNWRETTVEELQRKNLLDPEDLCFEAKYESMEKDNVKLLGQSGHVVCGDADKQKVFKSLQRLDSVWLCGTLHPLPENRGVEFRVTEVLRLPPDIERMTSLVERSRKREDGDRLIEIGQQISRMLVSNLYTFDEHMRFTNLRTEAWTAALAVKEKKLAPTDADGAYALAESWYELLRRTAKRRELIRRALRVDPEHPQASRVAVEELGLIKHEGRWMTKEEREQLVVSEAQKQQEHEAQTKELQAVKARQREEAVRQRLERLARYEEAVRMAQDPKALEGALRSLGEAVQSTPDPVFAFRGTDLLAQHADPAALWGLTLAAKSESAAVRQDIYEALAWRGEDASLRALAAALGTDENVHAVRGGVEALVRRRDKTALAALMDSLKNAEAGATPEILEGLRQLTNRDERDKQGWQRWWEMNRNRDDLFPKPQ